MKKILLSTVLAATLAVTGAYAKTITVNDSKVVSAQAITSTTQLVYVSGVDMNITTAINYISGDKIVFNIDSGSFNEDTYYLNSVAAEDSNMTSVNKTATSITFRAPSGGITTGTEFALSTLSDVLTAGDLNITGPSLGTAGNTLVLTVNSVDSTGSALDGTTGTTLALATAYNQFTAGTVSEAADGVVSVDADRLAFTAASSSGDTVASDNVYTDKLNLTFENNVTALEGQIDLVAADKINVVLTASTVDGIEAAAVGAEIGVIDTTANTITFELDGDTYATNGTKTISIDLNTTGNAAALSTRTFTVAAEIDLDTEEITAGLITAATTAGSWTVDGATIEMINMADNGLGTVTTAARLVNNDTANAAELYVTITNRTNATVFSEFKLDDTVPASGSYVLTAADLITAAVAAGNDLEANDDFTASVMMTVPVADAEAVLLQRSGTGQRVLGSTQYNLN